MYKVIYTGELEKVAGKAVFGATMKALLAEDKDVVYLDADLMNSIETDGLENQFPKLFRSRRKDNPQCIK